MAYKVLIWQFTEGATVEDDWTEPDGASSASLYGTHMDAAHEALECAYDRIFMGEEREGYVSDADMLAQIEATKGVEVLRDSKGFLAFIQYHGHEWQVTSSVVVVPEVTVIDDNYDPEEVF